MPHSPKRQKHTPSPEEETEDSNEDKFWAVSPKELMRHCLIRVTFPKFEACYGLEKLIPTRLVEQCDEAICAALRGPRASKSRTERASEALISRWLTTDVIASASDLREQKIEVGTNTTTNFCDIPWIFASTNVQVGVCVSEEEGKLFGRRLPLVCMEVHSHSHRGDSGKDSLETAESYTNTVATLLSMLIHQLRALRNFDSSIAQVCGFTFPRLGTDSAVTKITVSWQRLIFHAECQALRTVEEARSEIKGFFEGSVPALISRLIGLATAPVLANSLNAVPLSAGDLELFGEGSKQIPSNSSIIVYSPGKPDGTKGRYLKYNPSWNRLSPFEASASDVVVKAQRSQIYPFFEFEEHKQIKFEEAKSNAHKFVKAVAVSLDKLHKVDHYAHLDLHLSNICYDDDGVARFIDLDRAMPVGSPAASMMEGQYHSNMYSAPSDEWTMERLDWKQLGLLVGRLTQERFDIEHPTIYSGPARDLLDSLINQGKWDDGAYQRWVAGAVQITSQ